jgi:hypothetical protein
MAEIILGSIEHLHDKINNWTQEAADALHGTSKKGNPSKGNYLWENDNLNDVEGIVHYGPGLAAYYTAEGYETVLTSLLDNEPSQPFAEIWRANAVLYSISKAVKTFRTVNPIGIRIGLKMGGFLTPTLGETDYVYYRVQHPNNELGWPAFFSQDIDTYVSNVINDTTILLTNLRAVVESIPDVGYPAIKPSNRMMDSVGTYWRFFYRWNLSAEGCFARVIGELQKELQALKENGWTGNSASIETQAREKWQSALNI